MPSLSDLKVKIFADGANKESMLKLYANPLIKGFTTNPSLLRAGGVANYQDFAHEIVAAIPDRTILFEVIADEFDEMKKQAKIIAGWGKNVYVKIPVTNTRGESSASLVRELTQSGMHVTVTAMTTLDQVRDMAAALQGGAPAMLAVFAGRVADTGRNPLPMMYAAREIINLYPNVELLWSSTRETINIFQADETGCDIITVAHNLLGKLSWVGKDLHDLSLDTVKMFLQDTNSAGYTLP
jgi:transaldolase